MDRIYHLLIVDADVSYSQLLKERLSRNHRLTVVGIANDGITALELIQSQKPDILLIDPLLTEINGLSIIQNTNKYQSIHSIICLSQFYSPVSIELARRCGASYYLYKPIDADSLISVILHCADISAEMHDLDNIQEEISKNTRINQITCEILHELGFSPKLSGSHYIEQSIVIAHQSPMQLRNIHSGLYQSIAENEHTTPANIERCIRTAIASANSSGRLTALIRGTPTNKTCIRYILSLLAARI